MDKRDKSIKATHLSPQEWTNIEVTKYSDIFKNVVDLGRLILKTCLVMNGASALALLAFIGRIWTSDMNIAVIGALSCSLYSFALGVLSVLIAIIFAYLAERESLTRPIAELGVLNKESTGYFIATIIFVAASILCYINALDKFVDATAKYASL